jgi:rhodanese-related sulfurtransferase
MRRLATLLLAAAAWLPAQNPAPAPPQGSAFDAMVKEAKSRIKEIDPAQLKAMQAAAEPVTLIDVREDNEWATEHAQGAVHISRGMLEREIESRGTKKDAKLVLYCRSGARSALATDTLQKMGFTNAVSLTGGITAYKAAGLPVEK